jgi:GntR family transcriptional regulator
MVDTRHSGIVPDNLALMDLGTSRHRTVSLVLSDGIATGKYPLGEPLPGEEALAKMFQVSRVTIRRALADLDAAGLIERRHGLGTFVKKQPSADQISSIERLVGQVAKAGKLDVEVLAFEYCVPPPSVARLLKLAPDAKAQRAVRVRSRRGGGPVMHLTTYVPESVGRTFTRKDLSKQPLYQLLARAGKSYRKAQQTVSACLADPVVAPLLSTTVGAPLMFLQRVVSTDGDEPIEYLEVRAPPECYSLSMSWSAAGDTTIDDGRFVQDAASLELN